MLDLSNPHTRIILAHIGVMSLENQPEIDQYIDTLLPLITCQPSVDNLEDFNFDFDSIEKVNTTIVSKGRAVNIAPYIHLPLHDAATALNVTPSTLGRRWRRLTKRDWPCRRISRINTELKKRRLPKERIARLQTKLSELLKPKIVYL